MASGKQPGMVLEPAGCCSRADSAHDVGRARSTTGGLFQNIWSSAGAPPAICACEPFSGLGSRPDLGLDTADVGKPDLGLAYHRRACVAARRGLRQGLGDDRFAAPAYVRGSVHARRRFASDSVRGAHHYRRDRDQCHNRYPPGDGCHDLESAIVIYRDLDMASWPSGRFHGIVHKSEQLCDIRWSVGARSFVPGDTGAVSRAEAQFFAALAKTIALGEWEAGAMAGGQHDIDDGSPPIGFPGRLVQSIGQHFRDAGGLHAWARPDCCGHPDDFELCDDWHHVAWR